MKKIVKIPKVGFINTPYLLNKTDSDGEFYFPQVSVPENISIYDEQLLYIDVICRLQADNTFNKVTVTAQYRNEPGELHTSMSFNLYDNSSIRMNGIVSHVSVVAYELLSTDSNVQRNFSSHVIYTKSFPVVSKSCMVKTYETENFSGFDTISEAHYFGGSFKPNMELSEIQPYLFYIKHGYNEQGFINIISASDFINLKNDLHPAPDIKFESLSTLYDDIVEGKITVDIMGQKYKSVLATKNTLTSSLFIIKFKAV